MPAHELLQIHKQDNVAVAMYPIHTGQILSTPQGAIVAKADIPVGHKVALTPILKGDSVVKYGHPIGLATASIEAGQWVHTHNLATALSGKQMYDYTPSMIQAVERSERLPTHFDGYVRENGEVGIRNEIWIINTVGCINKPAEQLARMADKRFRGNGIDGVCHFSHPYGCSQLGDDLQYTQKILADLVQHPNAGGVLVLGLGCENNQIDLFRQWLGDDLNEQRVKFMSMQAVDDEFEAGMALLEALFEYARQFKRRPVSVAQLKLGMKCGGSDGFSGITANPLVGTVSDAVVALGGTAYLTEVPEMFGAETILMNRARDQMVFADVVALINDFKDYYERHGQVIYENPSPGNKDGGITTLEEKSLGCIQKGGTRPVDGVLSYGERGRETGLWLIQAPGNDMVSVTALAAAGAQMVLFSTGRGTPFGGPVPTVKISTNTMLYERKRNWIDFDAGSLAVENDMLTLRDALFHRVIDIASGRATTRNEDHDFREIAIFKDGVTL